MQMDPWEVADLCYVTTRGRQTGSPHTVEIWFGMMGDHLYLLSGGGEASDWVRNIRAHPEVVVDLRRPGVEPRAGRARIVTDGGEDLIARRVLAAKYQGWREGAALSSWARSALPVAVDFDHPGG
jgi:deazaflavin-dependent oxidoreductase (nitroreductase family)